MRKNSHFKRDLILSLGLTAILLTSSPSVKCLEINENNHLSAQVQETSDCITGVVSKVQFDTITKNAEKIIEERNAKPIKTYIGKFYITSYCSCSQCCGQYAYNRPCDEYGNEIVYGASGEILQSGYSIAVDTNIIPFGTKVEFDGKEYVAQDVGGAIKGNRIDVYSSSHSEALNFPTGYYEVYMEE